MGRLTPIMCEEVIPGDVISGNSEVLLRLAPLLAPIYDNITLYVHFFFVPNRLLWEDWEEFITGGRLGVGVDPITAPIPPYLDLESYISNWNTESSLGDYLRLPLFPGAAAGYNGLTIDALPFLGYQKIWLDFYRDRNFIDDDFLSTQLPVPSGLLADTGSDNDYPAIRTRDWMKEYFTASLPWTQRGTEVLMPLEGSGSVTYLDQSIVREQNNAFNGLMYSGTNPGVTPETFLQVANGSSSTGPVRVENIDEVFLTASSVSINDLRSAVRLQEWLERNAVGGSRYTESIQAHFAVRPQDSRLQRAEFIGGGRIPVRISEVVNTAFSKNDADETIPAGNLAGHGITYGNTNGFRYFVPEHGFIYGIMSIMSKPSYYQGIPRMFKRPTFLDYPWPTFAKLGEQPVYKYELFANPENLDNTDGDYPIFGYQSRYAEWKQGYTTNHGAFRSTLLFWTLARTFANEANVPVLDATFVNFTDEVQDRIFAVTGEDNFWCLVSNNITAKRALPYFGTPTL